MSPFNRVIVALASHGLLRSMVFVEELEREERDSGKLEPEMAKHGSTDAVCVMNYANGLARETTCTVPRV